MDAAILSKSRNLAEAFFSMARSIPERAVYRYAHVPSEAYDSGIDPAKLPREWRTRTFRDVAERVKRIATFLTHTGVKSGDRVAIISNSRHEWLEADFAILSVGAVVVSVYQSLTANDIGFILHDSAAKVIFAENEEQLVKLEMLLKGPCQIPATEEREASNVQLTFEKIITFEETSAHPIVVKWSDIISSSPTKELSLAASAPDDLASLVYTSGTTGPPKGVMQTHRNHLSNVRQAYQARIFADDSCLMLVLPLAHSFAKLMGYIGFLTSASVVFGTVASSKSSKLVPDSVSRDLRESGAMIFPLVPRLLEKMMEAILQRARQPKALGYILRLTLWSSLKVFKAREHGEIVPPVAALCRALTLPIRKKIRNQIFGPRFAYVVSGGAKLPPPVGRFFNSIDIFILEGYGLTETCVATNVNRLERNKLGTVGPVLAPDIEMKIASDGEILFRGPNIAKGYYNRPRATSSAWDGDGWFYTGDLGEIDGEGYLSITGRKKEIIVTAGGKKIAPEALEQRFKELRFISQIVIHGEGRPYCIALITLNKDELASLPPFGSQEFNAKVAGEFSRINKNLASFETVKKVAILSEELTVDNGLLTPSFKVKRTPLAKLFEDEIERIYESEQGQDVFMLEIPRKVEITRPS